MTREVVKTADEGCGTRVSIESMEEKTAYIYGGQGARQGC
jgi:hypothetical protein